MLVMNEMLTTMNEFNLICMKMDETGWNSSMNYNLNALSYKLSQFVKLVVGYWSMSSPIICYLHWHWLWDIICDSF
jgi:hypothetical protein